MPILRIFALLLLSYSLQATHNRAGEITYTQIDAFTIEATIAAYTKASSIPADRDSLELCWGDGNCQWVIRTNGPDDDNNGFPDGELLGNDNKRNLYKAIHSYVAFGTYTLSMKDQNRNGGILNVNHPASDQVPFYVETTFILSNEINHSPSFLFYPIDVGYVGTPFIHSAAVFDLEGDSIFYELITPLEEPNTAVPNYVPANLIGTPQGTLSIDSETGLLVWDAPNMIGEYVISLQVTSFKNGIVHDQIIRDMQIAIKSGMNDLCEINIAPEWTADVIEVKVGETIQVSVAYEELNDNQSATLSSSSGLYESMFTNPATFTLLNQTSNTGNALFEWSASSDQVREQPYQVVFKASDDLGLANFEVIQFRVVDELSSVESMDLSSAIIMFPNPAKDYLYFDEPFLLGTPYEIIDSNGKQIQKGVLDQTSIPILQIPQGIYFISFPELKIQKGFIKK